MQKPYSSVNGAGLVLVAMDSLISSLQGMKLVYPAPRTAAARGLNRTTAARRTALPPLL